MKDATETRQQAKPDFLNSYSDREGVGALTMLALVFLIGLFGGSARLLYTWPSAGVVAKSVGNLLTSILCAAMVGLALWEPMGIEHPTMLAAICGAAAWLGGDVIDQIARRLLRTNRGEGK